MNRTVLADGEAEDGGVESVKACRKDDLSTAQCARRGSLRST